MPSKKKTPAKKTAKKAVKKTVAKKAAKKTATKKVAKKAPTKKAAKKTVSKKAPVKKSSPTKKAAVKSQAAAVEPLNKAVVSRTGAAADKKSTPIVFSLDDVAELMAAKKSDTSSEKKPAKKKLAAKPKVQPQKKVVVDDAPVEKRVLGAASLADILGFNPTEKKSSTQLGDGEIPKKWKKYYKLLIDLRAHVSDEISLHTADTLKHSAREDAGDNTGYSNHNADAGTDEFDRDFALSLVSSEQDALIEIEEAILRIKDGSYGVCEITGKAIPVARLAAVPFTRYSVEGQVEHEKNQHRKSNRIAAGGIFGDVTDAPKLESSDDDE